jgi:glycerophosphoryl diester phosphodiesterase
VLDHDGVVRVGRRRRPIHEIARADLPPHIPALADLLESCGTDYDLSLDLKVAAAGRPVIDLIRSVAPAMLPRVWLCHPDVDVLVDLRPHDGDVRLVNSTRLNRLKEGPERRAAVLAEAGIDAVNMHHTDWTGGLTTLFHRFERVAFGWDMQFEHVLRPALRMGLDGVFSDVVDVMVDCFRAELGATPVELRG